MRLKKTEQVLGCTHETITGSSQMRDRWITIVSTYSLS